MKTCFKCHQRKPLSDFYRHPRMADGHLNKCKSCTRKDVRENRAAKTEYYREYERKRYRSDPTRRQKMLESFARTLTPSMRKAHIALNNAVRDGRIKKPSKCSHCRKNTESKRLHGHHHNYNKPLDVIWICISCHRKEHNQRLRMD